MKRAHGERNQPISRPPFPGNATTSLMRNQALFQNHSESVNKAIIRSNNLQLSFSEDRINPDGLLSFEASGGQLSPHTAGLNQHQTSWPTAMNRFVFGSRQFCQFISHPRYFQPSFRNAFSLYSRSNPQRIPSTTRQFQEPQRHRNGFTQQRNRIHTGTISASGIGNTGHKTKGCLNKNKVSMRREWQAMPEAEQCRPDEFSFSLVTYNMLSDSLLYENMSLYEDCNKDDLSWGYRKEKLLAELLSYDAEILCLQEVDACHFEDWFRPKLQETGYTGLFVQRTGGKPDGCAIFYRHAKFTLVSHKLVKYYTPKVQVLDKDNVGIVLLLKANTPDLKAENPFICVANTHLLFNKKRGDIKLAQLAYLFAEINELAVLSQDDHGKKHCPVIFCGDLNSLPYSPLYHFLITGQLDYSARSAAVISGQLASSESRRGPSSRRIRTPLLPWEFGVSADCQWRKGLQGNSEGSCTRTQDRHTSVQESSSQTRDIQDSEKDAERPRNAEDRNNPSNRCESNSSIQADPYSSETLKHVDSNAFSDFRPTTNTNRYAELNEVANSNTNRDSKKQSNFVQNERNKEVGEREYTPQTGGFNWDSKLDRNAECNRHSERSGTPGSNRYTEQSRRQRDLVVSRSQDSEYFRDIKVGEPDWKAGRQSKRNSDTIDLTRDSESPSPHTGVAELNRDSKSNRLGENKLLKDAKSNRDWTTGKSERNLEIIDLTRDTASPSSHNRAAKANAVGDSNKDPDFNRFTDSSGHTSGAGERHSDTPLSTASSEHTNLQTEKTNYNNNGTISIPWKFKSVYTHRFRDGTPEVTTCHSKACCNVDYIFYTTAEQKEYVQTGKLTLLGRLELMRKSDFNTMRLLPNHVFPSDHLSLQARFKLT